MNPKDAARKFINNQVKTKKPVPSMEEIRRRMGWKLIANSSRSR